MKSESQSGRIYLPALRGHMGDWVYYCTLMTLAEVSQRVDYAKIVHPSEKLSDLIQRTLDEGGRAEEIAAYLVTNQDRFFNALVVAVYGGSPDWHQIDSFKQRHKGAVAPEKIPEIARSSVGFLSLAGDEKLFALDGQHRLAGIKRVVGGNGNALGDEEVPIIFVAHQSNKVGDIRRTRKLFTTLNKTARPVKKNEIIALDEADVMALSARFLIEDSKVFKNEQIDVSRKQANLPQGDVRYWMTIINLYDALELLFRKGERGASVTQKLKFQRPTDNDLGQYFEGAENVFVLLGQYFREIGSLLSVSTPSNVIRKYRTNKGGHILFRPVGIVIFFELIAVLLKNGATIENAVKTVSKLPTNLNASPYLGTVWNQGRINHRMKALVRDMLLYRLGHLRGGAKAIARLKMKYSEALNQPVEKVSLD